MQCDNGNEFKAEVLQLCKELNIETRNGAPYKPTTQGSVENANGVFKSSYRAWKATTGQTGFTKYIPIHMEIYNSTLTRVLPLGVTPYGVMFGRERRVSETIGGTRATITHEIEEISDNDTASESTSLRSHHSVDTLVIAQAGEITQIEARVSSRNKSTRAQMRKQGGERTDYKVGDIVLLLIHKKQRLSIEDRRIPARVITVRKTGYGLLSEVGQLHGLHQATLLIKPATAVAEQLQISILQGENQRVSKKSIENQCCKRSCNVE